MDRTVFQTLRYLPDPTMGSDGHYLSFEDVFDSSTTEKDGLSLQSQKHKRTLSYPPVKQHALNVSVVIQCDECNKWILLFSKQFIAIMSSSI